MFRNYLYIGYRNLVKTKLFTLINILGLALSLASALLILFFVYNELTYDHYHGKSERIVRLSSVWQAPDNTQEMVITSQALGPVMKEEMPEVEEYCRIEPVFPSCTIKHEGKDVEETSGFYTSYSNVFKLFTFDFIHGQQESSLEKPGDIIVNASTAVKYFGTTDALHKSLTINGQPYMVSGVFKDFPGNVDLQIKALLYKKFPTEHQWLRFSTITYVLMKDEASAKDMRSDLDAFAAKQYDPYKNDFGGEMTFGLKPQRLRDIHFSKAIMMDAPKGNFTLVQVFIVSGIFLLMIAIFNFMNLTTIRAMDRTREVGIRKSVGANRQQLVAQFVVEYGLIVALAILLALSLLQLALPYFNAITDKQFYFGQIFADPLFWGIFLLVLFVPITVSLYPGMVISRFNTSLILKGKFSGQLAGMQLYKSLIVLQFVVSGTLIMGIYAVYKQMDFIETTDLGYEPDRVSIFALPKGLAISQVLALHNELQSKPGIDQVSVVGAGGVPASGTFFGNVSVNADGTDHTYVMNMLDVDEHYSDLMGMQIVEGEGFAQLPSSLMDKVVLVNESFVKLAGWQDAVGMFVNSPVSSEPMRVVGVVKDFHYNSLHSAIEPMLVSWRSLSQENKNRGMAPTHILVKMQDTDVQALESVWDQLVPNTPMKHQLLTDKLSMLYNQEQTMMLLFAYFTGIAILISCMGLFGLSQYIVQLRTKEIGIRKVLGATVGSIVQLLSLKFMVLILAALVVAMPVAWWGIGYWLDNFAYHIPHSADMFLLPSLLVILLAFTAIGSKTFTVARANPVDSLRDE